ncbi:hypothetical protein [Dyadobacter sp. NIV53]|uniref:hypothetical protein n=1 Tax=Dyadobacter sp. NIV53 TaxID=2861765 RepID=UPI001C86F86D|nr:hypothetical protein [Dyadobacter sp. NIV53]
MKKVIFVLLFATLFFSCDEKNKPAPEPELSGKVTGTYKINMLKIDGVNYPLDHADITVGFEKFSSEIVTGTMKAAIDGEVEPDEDLGNINLKNAGSTGVDLYEGTTKIGNVSKENVLSIYVDFEGTQFEMQGNKR